MSHGKIFKGFLPRRPITCDEDCGTYFHALFHASSTPEQVVRECIRGSRHVLKSFFSLIALLYFPLSRTSPVFIHLRILLWSIRVTRLRRRIEGETSLVGGIVLSRYTPIRQWLCNKRCTTYYSFIPISFSVVYVLRRQCSNHHFNCYAFKQGTVSFSCIIERMAFSSRIGMKAKQRTYRELSESFISTGSR